MSFLPVWIDLLYEFIIDNYFSRPLISQSPSSVSSPLVDKSKMNLEEKSIQILSLLKQCDPVELPDVDMKLHYLPPHIPKSEWSILGDLIVSKEKSCYEENNISINGSKWISLRLDGQGFSKTIKTLRKLGFFEEKEDENGGFSIIFANIMKECLLKLMKECNGLIGFTQSDEMIIIIPPTNIIKNIQQPHNRNGRIIKLATLSSGLVSSMFSLKLSEICIKNNIPISKLIDISPHFDCRVASYNNYNEVIGILLWRGYDCSINGISDATYQNKKICPKNILMSNKNKKLKWLYENNKLPLHSHQAYGTCYVRVKRIKTGYNPKLNKTVISLRNIIEERNGKSIHELLRTDSLILSDDILPASV
mmetsp:Transcript_1398/g.1807  ORF Transcript_1398/g.1807 Transcript_1398/m.1807 type:complete len:364 (-) Transcript_1398:45-1136(-)